MKWERSTAASFFDKSVRMAREEAGVLGLAVTGSRSVGFATPDSDFDFAIFVEEGEIETVGKRLGGPPPGVDMTIFTPSSFAEHATWGSDTAWDRYAWAIADFAVDRTDGRLVEVAREKGKIPVSHLDAYIDASLDWYLNQVARSLRCLHRGMEAAGYLNGAEAARPFLQAAFAIHDRRLVPYYKYLAWELEKDPLGKFPVPTGALYQAVLALVRDGSPSSQAAVLELAEAVFPREGYSRRFQEWETEGWLGRAPGPRSGI